MLPHIPRSLLLWLLLLLPIEHVPADQDIDIEESSNSEGECPADGSGPPHCQEGSDTDDDALADIDLPPHMARSVATGGTPYGGPKADLISQEIKELEDVIRLSSERIKLLKELSAALASPEQAAAALPQLPATAVRALREDLPLLSDLAGQPLRTPGAASEDFLVSKVVIPFDEEFDFLKFLPLRSPRTQSSTAAAQVPMPNALLVTARKDGEVLLLTPSGDLALAFEAVHDQPITHLAVPSSHEEYLVATCDAGGTIRVHKVSVRQRRMEKKEKAARKSNATDKISQHLGSSVNVTVQFQKQMQVPEAEDGSTPTVTTMAVVSQASTKFLLAGDSTGKITVFTRNGTVKTVLDTSEGIGGGVDSLQAVHGSVMYRSGQDWGYVDLEKFELRPVDCPMFNGRVMDAVLDTTVASRVMVTDEDGSVWIFTVKNKKDCKLDMHFENGTTSWPLHLSSVRGFVLGLEEGEQASSVLALNTSMIGKGKGKSEAGSVPPPSQPIVWRRNRGPVRSWSVQRRSKEGDLLAFLSRDGREIEIMELLMSVYTPPVADQFSNFKMPVIAVAVVLVMGYQYMKNKGGKGLLGGGGAGGRAGGAGAGGKLDFGDSDFAAALRNKKRLGGLGGLKGKAGALG